MRYLYLACLLAFASPVIGQKVIPLYFPDSIPNSIPHANEEERKTDEKGVLLVSKISRPTLTLFIPEYVQGNRPAVIICPGGGYGVNAVNIEGYDEARILNSWGVAAFVLTYRIPDSAYCIHPEIAPLQDAQQAILQVRRHAADWHIDPKRVGIMGFSAGGHLASTAGTHFEKVLVPNPQHLSVRPDWMILGYPVISADAGVSHKGSFDNLLGKDPSAGLLQYYSNEKQVTDNTPPAFLVHAQDDDGVPAQNSILFYQALTAHHVPAELHIYERGGHGFGLHLPVKEEHWMDRCRAWMQGHGWIDAQSSAAQVPWPHGRLKVSSDGHYLQYEDGTPFFWLGDTGWELFHRLTLPEIADYLDNRRAKGFNVIQAVALAEFDGLRTPDRYGDIPFTDLDPSRPNEPYWRIIDSTVAMARGRGLFIGLLPTWGDKVTLAWGKGPVIFDSVNAYTYGQWIGRRYKDQPNIVWILGGDRPARNDKQDWTPVWRAMARGIKEATGGHCLITYHPSGGSYSTSQFIHREPWLDVNMFQSGHGDGHDTPCWEYVTRDRNLIPAKPTLDAEPNYEDHPVNPWPKWVTDSGYYRSYDVRKQLYRSVFAGACGVTYGHHALWQFMSDRQEAVNYPDRGWINAMDRPGAYQAGYLRRLIESHPMAGRIPDNMLIVDTNGKKGEHMEAFTGADRSYAMVYLPVGRTVTIRTSKLRGGSIKASWFNPRDGSAQQIQTIVKKPETTFTAPTSGKENDWVLILD